MTKAFALGPDEGEFTSAIGSRIDKITAEATGGWTFAVETCPPGFEAALHIHHTEDGAFYILEGSLRMRLGDLEVDATPGTFVFMPRSVPHTFKVTSAEPARWVNVQGPTGDFQKLASEIDGLMKSGLSASEITTKRAEIGKKYGLEIVARPAAEG